jgi:hypothetical protein
MHVVYKIPYLNMKFHLISDHTFECVSEKQIPTDILQK